MLSRSRGLCAAWPAALCAFQVATCSWQAATCSWQAATCSWQAPSHVGVQVERGAAMGEPITKRPR